MTNTINLRQAKKQRARKTKARTAEANAIQFGRSKSEVAQGRLVEERARAHLDGHKRDVETDDG